MWNDRYRRIAQPQSLLMFDDKYCFLASEEGGMTERSLKTADVHSSL